MMNEAKCMLCIVVLFVYCELKSELRKAIIVETHD